MTDDAQEKHAWWTVVAALAWIMHGHRPFSDEYAEQANATMRSLIVASDLDAIYGELPPRRHSIDEARELLLRALENADADLVAEAIPAGEGARIKTPASDWESLHFLDGEPVRAVPRRGAGAFNRHYSSIIMPAADVMRLCPGAGELSAGEPVLLQPQENDAKTLAKMKVDDAAPPEPATQVQPRKNDGAPREKAEAVSDGSLSKKASSKRRGRPPGTGYSAKDAPIVRKAIVLIRRHGLCRSRAVKAVIGEKGILAAGYGETDYDNIVRRIVSKIPWPVPAGKVQ